MGNPNKLTAVRIVYMCGRPDLSLKKYQISELPGYPVRGCRFVDISASLL